MPLLTSPIDGSPMKQIIRNGIEIDMCPTTGGVWLDKGELEKLLALVQDAANDGDDDYRRFSEGKSGGRIHRDEYQHDPRYDMPQRQYRKYDDDDYYRYKHGKKDKLKTILDLLR